MHSWVYDMINTWPKHLQLAGATACAMSFLHSVGDLAENTAISLSRTALFCTDAAAGGDCGAAASCRAACARHLTLCCLYAGAQVAGSGRGSSPACIEVLHIAAPQLIYVQHRLPHRASTSFALLAARCSLDPGVPSSVARRLGLLAGSSHY